MSIGLPVASIIVVNWNGGKVLPKCLSSLDAQTFKDFEIIIVDNGSSDGSVDQLDEKYPLIKLVQLPENRGFAAANNIGAGCARGDWLVLLNNDAFPEPEWLEAILTAAQNFPEAAAFGSCMIRAEKPNTLDGTGDIYHISGLAWRRQYNHPKEKAG